jgi:hypothetical protein
MMTEREQMLHDHYASNAKARGHGESCDLVAVDHNWPTILGRPRCTCKARRAVQFVHPESGEVTTSYLELS